MFLDDNIMQILCLASALCGVGTFSAGRVSLIRRNFLLWTLLTLRPWAIPMTCHWQWLAPPPDKPNQAATPSRTNWPSVTAPSTGIPITPKSDPNQGFPMFSHFLIFAVSEEDCHVPKAYAHMRAHARTRVYMILLLCSTEIQSVWSVHSTVPHVSKFLRMIADIGNNSCLFRPTWQPDPGRGPARHEAVRLRSTARHIIPNSYKPANGNQARRLIICDFLLSLASIQASSTEDDGEVSQCVSPSHGSQSTKQWRRWRSDL